jgi:hypothetical protein
MTQAVLPLVSTTTGNGDEVEETITFDADKTPQPDNTSTTDEPAPTLFINDDGLSKPTAAIRLESDYEMIDDDKLLIDSSLNSNVDATNATLNDGEYELDELEAEIARELED